MYKKVRSVLELSRTLSSYGVGSGLKSFLMFSLICLQLMYPL